MPRPTLLLADTGVSGRWLLDFNPDGTIDLTLKRRTEGRGQWNWSSSNDYEVKDFEGLTRPAGASDVAASFRMVRDAGTVAFKASWMMSRIWPFFVFGQSGVPRRSEVDGLRRARRGRAFSLAVHDVSRAYIRELDALGYKKVPLDDLLSLRIHDAGPEFIKELKALGYSGLATDDLVSMSIHDGPGVHPGAQGPRLRPAARRRAGVHAHPRRHAAPHSGAQGAGYGNLPPDELVSMRIHDVTPGSLELKALGYSDLTPDELVSMRIHDVTPEFIRGLQELGYRDVPATSSSRWHPRVTLDTSGREGTFPGRLRGRARVDEDSRPENRFGFFLTSPREHEERP